MKHPKGKGKKNARKYRYRKKGTNERDEDT
jgi:hypothetical protein